MHATLASAEERWIKLTEVVPEFLHLSLSLSLLPHVKGTAMCQTPGRWSRASYHLQVLDVLSQVEKTDL